MVMTIPVGQSKNESAREKAAYKVWPAFIKLILHGFYNRMITNLMFGQYNEAVIKKFIKEIKGDVE